MPSSHHGQVSKILDIILTLNPQSVLDVGVGFGKYGFLCREYLELWDGREEYKNFLRRIDGIEAFPEYLTPVHDFVYSNIYIGDAVKLINHSEVHYDLVLLIDVLEHFTKEQGEELIKEILTSNKGVLISIPKDIGIQEDAFKNVYETHRANWSKKELSNFGNHYFQYDDANNIVYIGLKEEVNKLKRRYPLKLKVRKLFMSIPVLSTFLRFIKKILIRK